MTFEGIIEEARRRVAESEKRLRENGGMCLHCGKNPAEKDSQLNSFVCKECNKKSAELIKELQGPGFVQLKINS